MRIVKILFVCHIAALIFGLAGLLIALPHPELWSSSPFAGQVFNFGITYAGSLHIVLGAATMMLFGLLFVGTRKTLIFFVASTGISLSMELLGTSTGFPFGPYAYTDFLGFKLFRLVPYSIPLSWFYMGFTSYILAHCIVSRFKLRRSTLWSLLLGVYFLTAWDLSLDPAMASNRLPLHFWTWYEPGPYYGMPIRNLVGWSITGLIYMSVSRLLWRDNLDLRRIVAWLPFGVYAANTLFALALTLYAGLWLPSLMAIVLGLLPATLALGFRAGEQGTHDPLVRRISQRVIQNSSRMIARRNFTLTVEGNNYIPSHGPVLIAARHFHHLYDGCALLNAFPRRGHILVALDWVQPRWLRSLLELACRLVDWPIVLRRERLARPEIRSAYRVSEVQRYLRHAIADAVQLLQAGEMLIVFPEAYPVIDPHSTPKLDSRAILPFQSGFAYLAEIAERQGSDPVAIVPVGLNYVDVKRWQISLCCGPALFRHDFSDRTSLVQAVEERVRMLSQPAQASTHTEESLIL